MHDSLIVITLSNPSVSKKNNFPLPELAGDGVRHQAAFQLNLLWVVTDDEHDHFFGPPSTNPIYCYLWLPEQPLKRKHKNNSMKSYFITPDLMTEQLSHRKESPSSGKRGPTATYTSTWATPELERAGRLLLQKLAELMEVGKLLWASGRSLLNLLTKMSRLCVWTSTPETFPYVRKKVVMNSDQTAIPAEKSPFKEKPCHL